jgi:LysM repeat protein
MNKLFILFLSLFSLTISAQIDSTKMVVDSTMIKNDSINNLIDVSNFEPFNNVIINQKALQNVYEKLYLLEQNKDRKVRIVHLGDSHIQADIFTAKLRNRMQQVFGNAGFGFSFPYSLANTNNSAPIKYNGSGGFSSARNLSADASKPIGLSGISLETRNKNFHIDLNIKDNQYVFNKLKIISPKNDNYFNVAINKKTISKDYDAPVKKSKKKTHKVQPGEVLGSIADKYNVSISELKKANKLKSDNIRDGKTLMIPGGEAEITYKRMTNVSYEYEPINLTSSDRGNYFETEKPLEKITIIGNKNSNEFALNGIILENNNPGVTYSGIGVNGAKFGDYNKFPIFVEQLPLLEADLFVLSLGTNESYDLQDQETYYSQLKLMIDNIKTAAPEASILVTTPPPSVLHKKNYNSFIELYSEVIQGKAEDENYAVWNLLDVFGGNKNLILNSRMGLMAKDKVHYSNSGYDKQGELFFDAFIQSYELFKSEK